MKKPMFRPEKNQLFTQQTANTIESYYDYYTPPEVVPIRRMDQSQVTGIERNNALPIVAIVAIVGLLGLFGLLAYMKR